MQSDQLSTVFDLDDIITIQSSSRITQILSYSVSSTRKKILICTFNGFAIIDTTTGIYTQFQKEECPFYINPETECGVKIGYILQNRSEVALVPHFTSRKYNTTTVYIFDYALKTILYKNDFFLPISQIGFNQTHLIISNQIRIVLYNYVGDFQEKNQKYYLKMYKQTTQNNRMRYFQIHCNEYQSMKDKCECSCGKFVMSANRPFKLVYTKVTSINSVKSRSLMLYDQCIDKQSVFHTFPFQQSFNFSISQDGRMLSFSEDFGRRVKLYSLQENTLLCVLRTSREVGRILNSGFISPSKQSLWYLAIRDKQNGIATMHIFPVQKQPITQQIQSKYKRYFNLYKKLFKDEGISHNEDIFFGPQFYMKGGMLYKLSLVGQIGEVIDFNRVGNHQRKKIENFSSWEPAKE